MCKKGFTLIELVVALAIISILLTIGLKSLNYHSKIMKRVKKDYLSNAILNFIDMGKEYCKKNKKDAYISGCINENKLKIMVRTGQVYFFKFPNKFNLTKVSINDKNKLSINKNGKLVGSGYIRYEEIRDNDKLTYKVNIDVGLGNGN